MWDGFIKYKNFTSFKLDGWKSAKFLDRALIEIFSVRFDSVILAEKNRHNPA